MADGDKFRRYSFTRGTDGRSGSLQALDDSGGVNVKLHARFSYTDSPADSFYEVVGDDGLERALNGFSPCLCQDYLRAGVIDYYSRDDAESLRMHTPHGITFVQEHVPQGDSDVSAPLYGGREERTRKYLGKVIYDEGGPGEKVLMRRPYAASDDMRGMSDLCTFVCDGKVLDRFSSLGASYSALVDISRVGREAMARQQEWTGRVREALGPHPGLSQFADDFLRLDKYEGYLANRMSTSSMYDMGVMDEPPFGMRELAMRNGADGFKADPFERRISVGDHLGTRAAKEHAHSGVMSFEPQPQARVDLSYRPFDVDDYPLRGGFAVERCASVKDPYGDDYTDRSRGVIVARSADTVCIANCVKDEATGRRVPGMYDFSMYDAGNFARGGALDELLVGFRHGTSSVSEVEDALWNSGFLVGKSGNILSMDVRNAFEKGLLDVQPMAEVSGNRDFAVAASEVARRREAYVADMEALQRDGIVDKRFKYDKMLSAVREYAGHGLTTPAVAQAQAPGPERRLPKLPAGVVVDDQGQVHVDGRDGADGPAFAY